MLFHAWLLGSIYLFITDGGKMIIRQENESCGHTHRLLKQVYFKEVCTMTFIKVLSVVMWTLNNYLRQK